jgi:hypothetical protein
MQLHRSVMAKGVYPEENAKPILPFFSERRFEDDFKLNVLPPGQLKIQEDPLSGTYSVRQSHQRRFGRLGPGKSCFFNI